MFLAVKRLTIYYCTGTQQQEEMSKLTVHGTYIHVKPRHLSHLLFKM